MLPRAERATKPSPTIPISDEDRKGLDLRNTAVVRNRYLNATYKQLARDFNSCLNVPMASWYHFGYWASRTSGRFMTGERFRQMGPIARAGLAILGALNIVHSEREMIELFGHTNFLIGVEMVPAGKLFLKTFCSGGTLPSYETFGRHLEGGDLARQELHKAFEQYYLALHEQNPDLKLSLVAYGTTMQMMGEQRRAQNNVDALFHIGGPGQGAVESLYRWMAVASTGLELGSGLVIPFNKNVSSTHMPDALAVIEDTHYIQLHEERGVELLPVRGVFRGTAVKDWGNLKQRLRYLVAVVRGHGAREEILAAGN